jgi:hypothetical protein
MPCLHHLSWRKCCHWVRFLDQDLETCVGTKRYMPSLASELHSPGERVVQSYVESSTDINTVLQPTRCLTSKPVRMARKEVQVHDPKANVAYYMRWGSFKWLPNRDQMSYYACKIGLCVSYGFQRCSRSCRWLNEKLLQYLPNRNQMSCCACQKDQLYPFGFSDAWQLSHRNVPCKTQRTCSEWSGLMRGSAWRPNAHSCFLSVCLLLGAIAYGQMPALRSGHHPIASPEVTDVGGERAMAGLPLTESATSLQHQTCCGAMRLAGGQHSLLITCCGVLLLTVWSVRGSSLPGDMTLVSPMSVTPVTHLSTFPRCESRPVLNCIDPGI